MIAQKLFGTTKNGRDVTAYTLTGAGGLVMEVLDWGGRVNRIVYPDGKDVVIGFDSTAGWEDGDPYYGCLIGRYANRIANGKFSLDGKDYVLACNNFPAGIGCALHGSDGGWHDRIWKAEPFEKGTDVGLVLSLVSPDGEGGFPGEVAVKVTYTLTAGNVWRVDYEAESNAATPFAMTQHVYFNFKGEAGGTVEDHELAVCASSYAPCDAGQIPRKIAPVAATPFDFTAPHLVGERIDADDEVLKFGKGYDHCWVIDGAGFRKAAELKGAGKKLEVWTSEPAVQIYTGNWIPDGYPAKGADKLSCRCGIALETGKIPDAPNNPAFPNAILRPGERFSSTTEFRFA